MWSGVVDVASRMNVRKNHEDLAKTVSVVGSSLVHQ